jgi:hypothetical protein
MLKIAAMVSKVRRALWLLESSPLPKSFKMIRHASLVAFLMSEIVDKMVDSNKSVGALLSRNNRCSTKDCLSRGKPS